MKTFCLTTMIAVFLFISTIGIQAQTTQTQLKQVCLDNTEQFSIASKYVAGENYVIQVGLPSGYSSANKSYPVLYIIDGDVLFGMIRESADWLMYTNNIKGIIVVGISYGQGRDVWLKKRNRDLIPSIDTLSDKGYDATGINNYLKFIQFELFPVVNKNYRTNPDSSAILGGSYGGFFNSYVLFTQPELFKGYIIDCPALEWNNKMISKLETDYYNKHKELNATVFITYGSLETKIDTNTVNDLIQMLQTHNYKGLNLVTKVFEGETHTSIFPAAIGVQLRTLFKL